MRLLISGYYGFGNAGDEAVLAAMIQGLRERFNRPEIRVLSGKPAETVALHGVTACQRWSMREVWRAVGWADVVIQGGGGLIQDETSAVSPIYYLGILRAARLRRRPTVIFAQGVGPLRRGWLRRLAATELRHATAVTVRDARSLQELAALGASSPSVAQSADPALLLGPDLPAAQEALRAAGVPPGAPYALIALRPWEGSDRVVEACAVLARHLQEQHGLQPVAVPFQASQDTVPIQGLEALEPCVRVLSQPPHPAHLVGLVSRSRLVVSMRLHGLIFASSQAVPAVGISYDPKVDAFCALAGQPLLTVGDCAPDSLIPLVEHELQAAAEGLDARAGTALRLQDAARVSFEAVSRVAGQVPGS